VSGPVVRAKNLDKSNQIYLQAQNIRENAGERWTNGNNKYKR